MEALSDKDLLAQYAYTPHRMETGMVMAVELPNRLKPRIWETTSGLGWLDRLPVEVLHMSFTHLDLVSLLRVTRAARRGHELVLSMPDYSHTFQHASEALSALSGTRILSVHAISRISHVLRSAECVSCGNFGAFLFFLECERVCWRCLSRNQSMWVMPRSEAGRCFNLSAKQLKQLPCFRSIPGRHYLVLWHISRGKPLIMVGVRAAKRLALQVHGSQAALQAYLDTCRSFIKQESYYASAHLHRANLQFTKHDPCRVIDPANTTNDYYNGMASVPFPYQAAWNTPADAGVWCKGCNWTYEHENIVPDDMQRLFPSAYGRHTWFYLALRERRTEEFLAHAKCCYGMRSMVERKRLGIRDIITEFI